jgi:hypothetical protein
VKKTHLFFLFLTFLIFSFSNLSYGWQGRMGGMGDPYGLVMDESDFLIHPAGIANGKGINFYGGYRFNYTDVTDWNLNLVQFTPAGILTGFSYFDTSGQEYSHNALLGAAFPLGPGRMGLFFEYAGKRGDYNGHEDLLPVSNFARYDLTSDLDNFALRILYGIPVGGMKVGLELGMAYRDERQETWLNRTNMSFGSTNFPWSWGVPERSLFPFMIPYDSQYWELLWKAGMEVKLAPMTIAVSLRGGANISSANTYKFEWHSPVGTINENVDMKGDVAGWRIGSDIWVSVPGGGGLTFPFLFSIDYAEKKRNGDGIGTALDVGTFYNYTHKEKSLDIKVGGGVEKKFGSTALIAGGIYYNYLQGSDDATLTNIGFTNITADSSEFPYHTEHKVILRLAGEKEFSPIVALRMGLNFFYGWVKEDFKYTRYDSGIFAYNDNVSLDGSHWGIGASLGGTIKIPPITLEPFINGGYQKLNLNGDGERTLPGSAMGNLWGMDKLRKEWFIGGGFSIKFN